MTWLWSGITNIQHEVSTWLGTEMCVCVLFGVQEKGKGGSSHVLPSINMLSKVHPFLMHVTAHDSTGQQVLNCRNHVAHVLLWPKPIQDRDTGWPTRLPGGLPGAHFRLPGGQH